MAWDRIIGHDAVLDSFRRAVARGRLGQAYLFVGPRGVGKGTFARELAKALLCERAPEPLAACDHCPACAQVQAGTHPDVFRVVTRADKNELIVEDMHDFCAQMAMKPTRGGRKIGIVEDADDFNPHSANAFLKTLEEPPPGSLLILRATSLEQQLPTIQSRCQVARFAPLRAADLRAILAARGITDPARLDRLIRLADGSAAQAIDLSDDAVWAFRTQLIEGVTAPRMDFATLAEAWKDFFEEVGKETAAQRVRVALALRFLIEAVRQALRLATGASTAWIDPAEEARLRAFADRLGLDRLLDLADRIVEADYRVERKVQLILVVEAVLEQFWR